MNIHRYADDGQYLGTIDVPDDKTHYYENLSGYTNTPFVDGPNREGYAWAFTGDVWEELIDHTGETWYDPLTNEERTITALGDVPGDGWIRGSAPVTDEPINTDDLVKPYMAALEALYSRVVKADGWDSKVSCIARAGYENAFRARAIAFGQWMDGCNVFGYALMDDVIAGRVQMPTVEEFIAMLPPMVWPESPQ